ncbi:uncharacterized protein J3R85_013791 [Psidium guajava]|nr:uncharacterized protein J3R85_013791 [Psidium guajava]
MKSLLICVLGLFFAGFGYGAEVGDFDHVQRNLQSDTTDQPYRTGYHFQPPRNWMNGPMYYNGVYHLFYQYNPYGAVWGNIVWAHSVSYDLINWVNLEDAIYPTGPFDVNGCWSGSVTLLPGDKPAIFYTGSDLKKHQVQNLAMPKNTSDPLLREWVKSPHNPLITPPNGTDPNFFRDPTTAWQGEDKAWRLLVGSQIKGRGTAILYKSKDFIRWSMIGSLFNSMAETDMWECPDFYPVSTKSRNSLETSDQGELTKHVLKASFNNHDYYILGNYEMKTDRFSVENDDFTVSTSGLRYDYGKFYASKTFYDSAKERRVLWGWITESDSEAFDIKKGWSGLQSIPRNVLLTKSGKQLVQWPIKEMEKLRAKEVTTLSMDLKGGSAVEVSGITAAQADVEVSFKITDLAKAETIDHNSVDPQLLCSSKTASVRGKLGPFGLLALASEDLKEQTAIYFHVLKKQGKFVVLMCSDQSRSSLMGGLDKTSYGGFIDLDPRREKISLRSLIDHSIIESFGGEGKTCITARVYPSLAVGNKARLYVFNNGTVGVKISRLSAWSMKNAQIAPISKRRKPKTN